MRDYKIITAASTGKLEAAVTAFLIANPSHLPTGGVYETSTNVFCQAVYSEGASA